MRILLVHPGASWSTADVFDGLLPALRRAGHEVVLVHMDGRIGWAVQALDLAWRPHADEWDAPTWADAVYLASQGIIERALRFETDLVLIISAMYVHPDVLVLLRRAGLRTGVLLTESPYQDDAQLRLMPLVDLAWTNERTSVDLLRMANPHVTYLPLAVDPERHHPAPPAPDVPQHDVVFVGTGFIERVNLLHAVSWDGIDLGLYGNWPLLGSRNKLRRYLHPGPIPNALAADLYRATRIGLNLYRTSVDFGRHPQHVGGAQSLNPRALELAADGVFTLSDAREEVTEVFGDDVPTFAGPDELEEQVRWWLAHDDERRAIAARLPARVAGRTFDAMAQQIVLDFERVFEEQRERIG